MAEKSPSPFSYFQRTPFYAFRMLYYLCAVLITVVSATEAPTDAVPVSFVSTIRLSGPAGSTTWGQSLVDAQGDEDLVNAIAVSIAGLMPGVDGTDIETRLCVDGWRGGMAFCSYSLCLGGHSSSGSYSR